MPARTNYVYRIRSLAEDGQRSGVTARQQSMSITPRGLGLATATTSTRRPYQLSAIFNRPSGRALPPAARGSQRGPAGAPRRHNAQRRGLLAALTRRDAAVLFLVT